MSRCETCDEWIYTINGLPRSHECPPVWQVATTEYKDDPDERSSVYASDAEAASERFAAEYYDAGDPPDSGDDLDVSVLDGDTWRTFRVTAEYSLDFDAREIEPCACDERQCDGTRTKVDPS